MSGTENIFLNQIRNGRSVRPAHWKDVAALFNATRSYVKVLREYPEAFLDIDGVRVTDGCGRMRCLRWSEDLLTEARNSFGRVDSEADENGDGDGNQRKKPRKQKSVSEADFESESGSRDPSRQSMGGRTRTDRPDYWRDVARFFIESRKFQMVKIQFPEAFLDAAGNPATDSCAKMRVLRWKDDYNIELLEGGMTSTDGAPAAYGNQMDKILSDICRDLIESGGHLDETVVQDLLLEELRKTNQSNLHVSEGGMNSFGKLWASRFFKRHKFLNGTKGTTMSHSSSTSKSVDAPDADLATDETDLEAVPKVMETVKEENRVGCWKEVAQLFMACGSYKTVKKQFPDVFLDSKKAPMSDGAGKMLCQKWKEDLIVEQLQLNQNT